MSVHKDKNGKWLVKLRYTDWRGDAKDTTKRGFSTKREATEWERNFLLQKAADLNMTFADFAKVYRNDREPRLKESTQATKDHIITTKLIPAFGKKRLCDISASDIVQWQNELLRYHDPVTKKPYSKSYLKTVHNQLSAILNHAVRYYGLKRNEAAVAGNMGSEKDIEMDFWTKEEYLQFSEEMMDDPKAYYCFEMLYWCGIREGEVLALCKNDFNFTKQEVSITKTYHRLGKRDIITDPKTPKGRRKVQMPEFLCEEMQDYFNSLYDLAPDERIFPFNKGFLHRKMTEGSEKAGIKRIRVHDLRHSHVSLLINMGFSAIEIADRVGHESIDITYRYAHLFPNTQRKMANTLNMERMNS